MTNNLTACFKKLDYHRIDEIEDHEIKAYLDALH